MNNTTTEENKKYPYIEDYDPVKTLEKSLNEFDYLFQEGVVCGKKEIENIKHLLVSYNNLINDGYLKVK